jgi:hypothetical protein
MEKQIKSYRDFLVAELAELDKLPLAERLPRVRALSRFHRQKIAEFQHERLIHLLVTFFFAFLFLTFTVLLPVTSAALAGAVPAALFFLPLIVLVTLAFYIRHYFFLENSIQALYLLGNRLWDSASGKDDVLYS